MPRIVADGLVSDIQRSTEIRTGGSDRPGGVGKIERTEHLLVMKIGSQVAQLKSPHFFAVTEGERVVAAGKVKDGVLKIGAVHNLTAGTQHNPPIAMGWTMAGLLMFLGLPSSVILIGIPFVGLSIYNIVRTMGWQKDLRLVTQAAREARPGVSAGGPGS